MKLFESKVFALWACVLAFACSRIGEEQSQVTIYIDAKACQSTKSVCVDEYLINDVNILVFNQDGLCVLQRWMLSSQMTGEEYGYSTRTNLYNRETYDVYAFANLGYALECKSIEELEQSRFYLAYPDELSSGLPMRGRTLAASSDAESTIRVSMERMMAKVSVRIDRSRLDDDSSFSVMAIKVGATPRSMPLWGTGFVTQASELFANGYTINDDNVYILNSDSDELTDYVSVYILENDQGVLLPGNNDVTAKILPSEHEKYGLCSYIEIFATYESSSLSSGDGYLRYRFYIGEDPSSFDVSASAHYKITVIPSSDGLLSDSWRCDTSCLVEK